MRVLSRRRRGARLLPIAAAAAVALAACGSSGSSGPSASTSDATAVSKGGGSLVVGSAVALTNSDPIRAASSRDQSYLWTVYDTLLTFKPDTIEPAPGLAESWDQPDPRTLVLHLRKGVTFQDGTPFDAEAVKFNIERAKGTGATTVGLLASVDSVDATDPSTATLHLNKPDSSLLLALSDLPGMMVSPTAAKKSDTSLATTPVGAGPYRFVSQVTGSNLVVTRYDGYWDKSFVGPAKIELKAIADPATQANALRSGQINLAINVDASQVNSLKSASGVTVTTSPSFETIVVLFNLNRKPLDNPKVRAAIDLAVDRKALVSKAEFGFATPSRSILPKDSWAYPAGIPEPSRDVNKAKQLLADAGFAGGVTFEMIVQPTSVYQRLATLLQSQLAETGITLKITPLDLATNTKAFFKEQKYDSELASFGGRQDPATAYAALYSTTGFLNPGASVIPGVDEGVAKANSGSAVADRKPALQELGKIVSDNSISTVLYQRQLIVAHSDDVIGYEPNILGKPKYFGISAPS